MNRWQDLPERQLDQQARMRELLRMVAAGLTARQIAVRLGVTERAAHGRVGRMVNQLGARNAAHAVVVAAVSGLLTAEDLRAAAGEDPQDVLPLEVS